MPAPPVGWPHCARGRPALPAREVLHTAGHGGQRLRAVIKEAAPLDKIVHAQGLENRAVPLVGRGVVGSGEVIAQRLGDVPAQENASGVLYGGQQGRRDRPPPAPGARERWRWRCPPPP